MAFEHIRITMFHVFVEYCARTYHKTPWRLTMIITYYYSGLLIMLLIFIPAP